MITLTVVAFNNTPADGTLQVHFDELGGSIGRADTNQLVLPDPERMVSRVAAQVVYRNGGFVIVDRGSNPISLNGRALASGREAPLAEGDRVHICGYELSVKLGGAGPAAPSDPFSKLLGPAPAARSPVTPWVDPLGSVGHRGASRRDGAGAASRRNPGGLGSVRDPTARRPRAPARRRGAMPSGSTSAPRRQRHWSPAWACLRPRRARSISCSASPPPAAATRCPTRRSTRRWRSPTWPPTPIRCAR